MEDITYIDPDMPYVTCDGVEELYIRITDLTEAMYAGETYDSGN